MTDSNDEIFQFDKMKTNVRRMGYLFVFLFGNPSWTYLVVGSALILLAVLLHGWAAGYLARAGYSNREAKLTVQGPYRHTRNPYYLAHLVMDLGFFLVAGMPLWYLVYFPFIFGVYQLWVLNEEEFLEKEFGDDYRRMKSEVPRWGFRVLPAPSQGYDEVFTWSDYFYNNELKRTLSHLFLVGLFWDFFYLANPFLSLSLFARFTIVGFVGTWMLLRDVQPQSVEGKRPVFLIPAGFLLLIGACTVFQWEFHEVSFSGFRSLGFAAGIILLVVLGAGFLESVRNRFTYFYESTFKDPLLSVLYIFLGVSLVSGSVYALWTGLLISQFFWVMEFAGFELRSFRHSLTPVS